jgi:carboxypeptidase Taq
MTQEKLNQLKTILAELSDISGAASLLGWDQQVNMPPGGAKARGQQLGTLRSIAHQKFTSPEVAELLEELKPYADSLDPDSNDARLIKVTARDYSKRTRVPKEFIIEMSQITSQAHQIWQQARRENNFYLFQPYLEKIVELRQQYAGFFAPYDHVYDPLLDDFEPGLKTRDVQKIFHELRPKQIALIQAISEKPQVDDSFLYQSFEEKKQWDFGVDVITRFGYDWEHGRQDKSTHPFTSGSSIYDVRITTRVYPDFLKPALFATMHEAGHALYGLGIDPAFDRTPLSGGASLAVHESQSRMWENLVGRSLAFWEFFYPKLQETFPGQLGQVSLQAFYKGINKVEPSLIRVEADEATYNLHIMLRLELEIALMEGSLAVQDLPEAWNSRMRDYLGVTPPTNADGVLQDIHWSGGMIGYFSTYALGNLISAQLWECILKDIPDLEDQFRRGEFSMLLAWLREKIHRHGEKYEPQELVKRITGSTIDPAAYIRYLQGKFGAIYGLS